MSNDSDGLALTVVSVVTHPPYLQANGSSSGHSKD